MSDGPLRYIGTPEPYEAFFWASGEDGRLRLQHCDACDRFHHPPQPICPYCHSSELDPRPVAGTGRVASYTINHQPFMPGFEPPYSIAFVEIDEDPTIRLCTNLVGIDLDAITIGLRVQVVFEQTADAWIPLFRPVTADAEES